MQVLSKDKERTLAYVEDNSGIILIERTARTSTFGERRKWDEDRLFITKEELRKLVSKL